MNSFVERTLNEVQEALVESYGVQKGNAIWRTIVPRIQIAKEK